MQDFPAVRLLDLKVRGSKAKESKRNVEKDHPKIQNNISTISYQNSQKSDVLMMIFISKAGRQRKKT